MGAVLEPHGFRFQLLEEGTGSGGRFASGNFVRHDRRLELHYRHSLGQVAYHFGTANVQHEQYMRALGVWQQCKYPGFSKEPLQVFRDLAHDLAFASDFTTGDAAILIGASRAQKVTDDTIHEALLAGYQGQTRMLSEMRDLFKREKYAEVVTLYEGLPAPHLLTDSELQIVRIARQRRSDA